MLDSDFLQNIQSTLASLQADKPVGVDAAHLSKLWLISEPLAQAALDQNTKLYRHNEDNTLSHQFTANDRMLRDKRVQSVFFTDAMFAMPKAKSIQGNTCC